MKPEQSALTRAIAIVTLIAATPGCSFMFVKTPPADGRILKAQAGECTSSRLAPGLDTAFGTLQLVRTAVAAAAPDSVYEDPKQPLSRGADIGLGVGFAALFVGSAVYGFVNTSRCGRLKTNSDSEASTPDDPTEKWEAAAPASPPTTNAAPAAEPAAAATSESATAPEPPATESPASGDAVEPLEAPKSEESAPSVE